MSAHSAYLSSIFVSFSTFLSERGVVDRAAHDATLALAAVVEHKTDWASWDLKRIADFWQTPIGVQHSSSAQALVTAFIRRYPPTQINVFVHEFCLALAANGCSHSTVKNYRSDISQFAQFGAETELNKLITKPKVADFLRQQRTAGLKHSSIRRKLVSIQQFANWAASQDIFAQPQWFAELFSALENAQPLEVLDAATSRPKPAVLPKAAVPVVASVPVSASSNPGMDGIQSTAPASPLIHQERTAQLQSVFSRVARKHLRRPSFGSGNPGQWALTALVLLVTLVGIGFFGYQQLLLRVSTPLAYPTSPTRPNRQLSFQGRLTDTAQNPITTATDMRFYLYDSGPSTGSGSQLWDSGTCSVTPDQDGIFSVGLGDDCGTEITEDVFSENSNVWLEVEIEAETLDPRQAIQTVPYALNSETLQGYPITASGAATVNTVVTMNSAGEVVLGEVSPSIRSVSGTFSLEAQTLSLETSSGSNGDIILSPDGTGEVQINADTVIDGYLYAPGATLSATYAGGTALVTRGGPSGTANIQEWQNSAGTALTVVDESGNVGIGTSNPSIFSLQVAGNIGPNTPDTYTIGSSANEFNEAWINTITTRLTTLNLQTSGSGHIRLDSAGGRVQIPNDSLGIGTDTPDRRVEILDASNPQLRLSHTDSSVYTDLQTTASGYLYLNPSGGRVGIGTSTPDQALDIVGNLKLSGTTTLNSLTYTWPASQTNGYVLSTNGSGTLSWSDPAVLAGGTNLWDSANGTLYPKNSTLDLLIGGTATSSAKFAFINNNSGTPTATISGNLSLQVPTGSAPATTFNVLNGGSLNIRTASAGQGDAGLSSRLFIHNDGNIGIGTTAPGTKLDIYNANNIYTYANSQLRVRGTAEFGSKYTTNSTEYGDIAPNASVVGSISVGSYLNRPTDNIPQLGSYEGVGTYGIAYSEGGGGGVYLTGVLGRARSSGNTSGLYGGRFIVEENTVGSLQAPAYGVHSTANSTNSNTNYGGYFSASNGATNYGVYSAAGLNYFNGNVGIATTNPAAALQVAGVIRAGFSGEAQLLDDDLILNSLYAIRNVSGDIQVGNSYASSLSLYSGSNASATVRLRINSSGNVGIGTTTPIGLLNVSGAATGKALTILNETGDQNILTASSSGTTRLVVTNAGNVGIGISSPNYALATSGVTYTSSYFYTNGSWVIGNGSNYGIYKSSTNSGYLGDISGTIAGSTIGLAGPTSGDLGILLRDTGSSLVTRAASGQTANIQEWQNNGGTQLSVIDAIGNIGIGSSAPTEALDVVGNLKLSGTTTLNSLTYTWPASQSNGYVLSTNGSGTLSWSDPAVLAGGTNLWDSANGTLYPKNATLDLLIGGTATSSAKFAFINSNSGTPTATISGNLSLQVPTGTNPATTFNVLNGGSLNIRTATTGQGDAGLTSRIFVQNDGNVGIGTTSPGVKFQVDGGAIGLKPIGTAGIVENSTIATIYSGTNSVENGNGSLLLQARAGQGVGIVTGTSGAMQYRLVVENSGNVGIGTSNAPVGLLQVSGAATGKALTILNETGDQNILVASASGTNRLTLTNAGNLGLGTTAPAQLLHANAGTTDSVATLRSSDDTAWFDLQDNDTTGVFLVKDSYLSLGGSSSLSANNLNINTTNGNIGINTLTPSQKLDVVGEIELANYLYFDNGTSEYLRWDGSDFILSDDLLPAADGASNLGSDAVRWDSLYVKGSSLHIGDSGNEAIIGYSTGSNYLGFDPDGDTTAEVVINDNGNIGIGSLSPAAALDVVGDVFVSSGISLFGTAVSDGLVEATTFCTGDGETNCISDFSTISAGSGIWATANGAIYPTNSTRDLLIGGTATSSAKFAFLNVDSGTPTASVSAGAAGGTYLTAGGKLATTALQNLTLGDSTTTGDVIINPSRNVGIGTTAATSKLTVNGGIMLTPTSGLIDFNSSAYRFGRNGNDFYWTVAGVERMRLRFDGNLGIGTSSPTQLLDVNGDIRVRGNDITDSGDTTRISLGATTTLTNTTTTLSGTTSLTASSLDTFTTGSSLTMGSTTTLTLGSNATLNGGAAANDDLTLQGTSNATRTSSYVLLQPTAGNVGIGSTTPGEKLDVVGNFKLSGTTTFNSLTYTWPASQSNGYVLSTNGSGTLSWTDPNTLITTGDDWDIANGALYPKNATLDLLIGGTATSSAKFAFINNNSGTPTATISGNLSLQVPTGSNPATTLNVLNGGALNIRTATTGQGDAGLNSRLYVANSGNIGINTTNPQNLLHIVSSTANKIQLNGSGIDASYIAYGAGSTTGWLVGKNTSGTFRIENAADTNIGLAITGTGLASINDPTPGANWQVDQASDGQTVFQSRRATDTSPTGDFLKLQNAGGSTIGSIDINANMGLGGAANSSYRLNLAQSGTTQTAQLMQNGQGSAELRINASGNFEINGLTAAKEVVFNQAGDNVDLRVEGDTNANLFFVDASADYIGIGTTNPTYKLDVAGTGRYTGAVDLDADLELNSTLTDVNGSVGTSGQILSSTGTGVDWIDAPSAGYTSWVIADDDTDTYSIVDGNILRFTSSDSNILTNLTNGDDGDENMDFSIRLLGDAVAGAGLTGGADNVLVGADADVTFAIGAGDGITVNADDVAVNQAFNFAWTGTHSWSNSADFNGDVSIADTNIAFDGASTTFTTTGAFTLTPGGAVTLGDGGDTMAINTSDWDISTTGSLTGISGIANDGAYTQTGTSANTFTGAVTVSGILTANGTLDLNGTRLILDADADTSITADTDDQIDIEIAGADDFRFTANTFIALSGSTVNINSGATLDVNGDLAIADTNISLDGASTTFTQTTGAISLAPAAGANLNITLSGTGDFVVNTNDLVVDTSSGNIGIGSVTPAAALDVVGDIFLSSGLSTFGTAVSDGTIEATKFCTGDGETNCVTDFAALPTLSGWTDDGTTVRLTAATDYVAIGAATADGKVGIDGARVGQALLVLDEEGDQDIWTASASGTNVARLSRTGDLISKRFMDWSNTAYYLDAADSTTSLLTAGNVGIGTTNPQQLLHVYSGTVDSLATFRSSDDIARIDIQDNDTTGYLVAKDSYFSIGGTNTLSTANINIDTVSGNFGVGTTTPAALVDVVKSSSSASTGTTVQQISFTDNAGSTSLSGITNNALGITHTISGSVAASRIQTINGANIALTNTSTVAGDQYVSGLRISNDYSGTPSGANQHDLYGLNVTTSGDMGLTSTTRYGGYFLTSGQANNNYGLYLNTSGATTDWGIYSTGEDKNYLSGNLGIGTTSPGGKLNTYDNSGGATVTTALRLDRINSSGAGTTGLGQSIDFFMENSSSSVIEVANIESVWNGTSDANLNFNVYSAGSLSTAMTIYNNGNIGIGTTDATQKLDVNGDLRVRGNDITDSGNTTRITIGNDIALTGSTISFSGITTIYGSFLTTFNTSSSLTMGATQTLTLGSNSTLNGGSVANDDLTLQGTSNATRTSSYVLLQPTAGNVGIGTTAPAAALDIQGPMITDGSLSFQSILANNTTAYNSSPVAGQMFYNKYNSGGSYAGMGGISVGKENTTDGNYSSYLALHTRTHGSAIAERLRINSSGNVGIGSTNPAYKFDLVTDVANYAAKIFNDGNSTSRTGLIIQVGTDSGSGTNTAIRFNDGDGTQAGQITFTGTTMTYGSASDVRLKEKISDTRLGLAELMNIQVADYTFKSDTTQKRWTGFLAQQLYQYFPDAVAVPNNPEDQWNVDYGKVTPLIVKSIQEQQAQITAQQTQLATIANSQLNLGLNSTGQVTISQQNGEYVATATSTGTTITTVAGYADAIAARVTAGLTTTRALVVQQSAQIANLSATNITVAGQNLRDYIASIVRQTVQDEELLSPVVETQVALQPEETFSITTDSGSTVASIDATGKTRLGDLTVAGDASISGNLSSTRITALGQLTAGSASVAGQLAATDITAETVTAATISAESVRLAMLEGRMAELETVKAQTAELVTATVSGTLYANNIDGFDAKVAAAFEQPSLLEILLQKTGLQEQPAATQSGTAGNLAQLHETLSEVGINASSSADLDLSLEDLELSTEDATLTASAAFINDYLKVNGSAYINNSLAVRRELFVGEGMHIADGSIEYTAVPGESQILAIQPSGKGTLSLLAGLMELNESGQVTITGNLAVAGDVKVEGSLLSNLLQPAEYGNPFQVQVAGIATESGKVKESRFEIINELGAPVATISAQGRAAFAGGIGIGSESLDAPESEENTVTARKTSGKAAIAANTKEVTIKSELLTGDSLIYVTPVGSTENKVLYVKSQTAENPDTSDKEGRFVVGFDEQVSQEVQFNWWVVN